MKRYMKGFYKLLTLIISILSMLIGTSSVCFGNAAEPPSILIIVPNPPEDLAIELSLTREKDDIRTKVIHKANEAYYTFYAGPLSEKDRRSDTYIKVSTGGDSFQIKLDNPANSYNNIYTLDLKKHSLTPGKLVLRSIILVLLRLSLTLILEGIVFWLLGYRQKRSWIAFAVINLITQGYLNIWINSFSPMHGYMLFSLILAEALILLIELIAFILVVNEHSRWRSVLYVFGANILSLIAGGYLITWLPV